MKNLFQKTTAGFTLVEVMISIGLFTVVMVIGIGAILGVSSTHRKTQAMRTVVDNLSFLVEDMSRSMRLGGYFVCVPDPVNDFTLSVWSGVQNTSDGTDCKGISFEPYWSYIPSDYTNQVIYMMDEVDGVGTIFKKEAENTSLSLNEMKPVTPAEINIDVEHSGFTVIGSDPNDAPKLQPKVIIVLKGKVKVGNTENDFNLQTTVSARLLDVTSLTP
jgi:prepilin-type N-terminal cleavage/methylation domain-containing protein